jgi:hypothetical protein
LLCLARPNDASLEHWLVRVVASACRRIGRGATNDATAHDPEVELTSGDDPEDAAARRELAARLDQALLALSPQDRSILLLAELEDFSATLGVRGFPTFLGFRDSEVVARQAGFGGRRGLEALAETLLAP